MRRIGSFSIPFGVIQPTLTGPSRALALTENAKCHFFKELLDWYHFVAMKMPDELATVLAEQIESKSRSMSSRRSTILCAMTATRRRKPGNKVNNNQFNVETPLKADRNGVLLIKSDAKQ
jgi:hypothetical protein